MEMENTYISFEGNIQNLEEFFNPAADQAETTEPQTEETSTQTPQPQCSLG